MEGELNKGINKEELINNIKIEEEGIKISTDYIERLKRTISYEKALCYLCISTLELYGAENKIDKAIKYIESYLPNYDFDKTNLRKLLDILGDE